MKADTEITGVLDYERNVFGADDDRTVIAILADGTVVKGKARKGELEHDLTYLFRGYWTEHPRYGKQFAFHSFGVAQPAGKRGTVAYLSRGPGIGRKRAMQLWNLYGADAINAIRSNPEGVAAEINGLAAEKATQAAAYFQAHKDREVVTRDLEELLSGGRFPKRLIDRLIERWGAKAAELIRENPYRLIMFSGVGYAKADQLYLRLGGDPVTPERLGWCCWAALHKDSSGSTWQPIGFGYKAIQKGVAGMDAKPDHGINWAIEQDHIAYRRDETGRGREWIAEGGRAAAEMKLTNHIHRAITEDAAANWPSGESLTGLSDHQREQYEIATSAGGHLVVLGGRPGTGKTYALARILTKVPSGRCAVAAPTGKAAVRITESLQRAGAKDLRATTIHSLLGPDLDEDSGQWLFAHNESNPIDLDWIFVDESSMCDTALLGSLLAARKTGCRVMLIGDVNQLSPVGHGAPLRDLIAAGLPYGELTEIQRNSGRIVRCCHGIVDNHRFEPSPKLDLVAESPENLLHVEKREPTSQIETLKTVLEKFRQGDAINGQPVDPIWGCQILVPVNDRSPICRTKLNAILQGHLNPGGKTAAGNSFRVGDKIVNGRNGWLPAEKSKDILEQLEGGPWNKEAKDGGKKVYCANGEQAAVVAVFPRYTIARLWLPDRIIRIPQGQQQEDEDGNATGTGCNWDLAYALSVHKSQGSQWPVILVLADAYPGARMLCDRSWLYTALSRAETLGMTIGQRVVLDEMCNKSHIWNRKTFLAESIGELQQAGVNREWEEALV